MGLCQEFVPLHLHASPRARHQQNRKLLIKEQMEVPEVLISKQPLTPLQIT